MLQKTDRMSSKRVATTWMIRYLTAILLVCNTVELGFCYNILPTRSINGFQASKRSQQSKRVRKYDFLLDDKSKLSTGITDLQSWNELKKNGLSLALGMVVVLTLPFSLSANTEFNPSIYNNEYDDPLHPLCKRRIEVSTDGKTFHYSGTAVGPKGDPVLRGCSKEEIRKYKWRKGAFDGLILENGKISAGDGIHEGEWEPAGSVADTIPYANVDGIRWNDGNKWTVKTNSPTTIVGETVIYGSIGFSALAGAKGLLDAINRKRREAEEQFV